MGRPYFQKPLNSGAFSLKLHFDQRPIRETHRQKLKGNLGLTCWIYVYLFNNKQKQLPGGVLKKSVLEFSQISCMLILTSDYGLKNIGSKHGAWWQDTTTGSKRYKKKGGSYFYSSLPFPTTHNTQTFSVQFCICVSYTIFLIIAHLIIKLLPDLGIGIWLNFNPILILGDELVK